MRLRLRLPEVRPDEYKVPMTCPYGCGGRYFALHQQCQKELSDPHHPMVQVRRYKCGAVRAELSGTPERS